MNFKKIIPSILKVVGAANVDVTQDLQQTDDNQKTIAQLLNEQEKAEGETSDQEKS